MAYHCVKRISKECDGCGCCQPEQEYYCPVCGEKIYETVFVSFDGEVIGCENCAETKEPHEVFEI